MANQDSRMPIPEIFTPSGMMKTTLDFMEQSVEALRTLVPGGQTMATRSRTIVSELARIADRLDALSGIDFSQTASGPHEEVLIFYDVGTGSLVLEGEGAPYWHLTGSLYHLSGKAEPRGTYETVFPFDRNTVRQVFIWPPEQDGPYDRPPVISTDIESAGYTKARFTFADGSELVAVGPGITKVNSLRDGSVQLEVSVASAITYGSGGYAGARGMHTALGSSWFREPPNLETGAGLTDFAHKALFTFKILRRDDLGPSAGG